MAKKDSQTENLQGNFSEIQKQLEASIKKFQEANNLIKNRQVFLENKNKLQEFLKELSSQEDSSLESKQFKIKLCKGEYRDEDAISISNKLILNEFIIFVSGKIDSKVEELELKIIA